MLINNKKILFLLISLLLLKVPAFGKETIRFGLVPDFVPMTFVTEGGKPTGFVIELYSQVMNEFGYQPEYIIAPFKELYNQLLTNQLDFFGTLTRRPDRENLFFWPKEPTITGWGQLFVAEGKSINNINDIRGVKVGLISNEAKGKSFITHMSSLGISFEKVYFASFKELIKACPSGKHAKN